jgi:hypothetical protein
MAVLSLLPVEEAVQQVDELVAFAGAEAAEEGGLDLVEPVFEVVEPLPAVRGQVDGVAPGSVVSGSHRT